MKVEEFKVGELNVSIHQDEDAENPRSWDNFGKMVYAHRRYILGDEAMDVEAIQDLTKDPEIIWLPLYLYDHSGLTMRTTAFSCPWDSGQVGIIYTTKEAIRKEYSVKKITKAILTKVYDLFRAEVNTFDQYLTGDVYGYVIEKDSFCDHGENHPEHIDSCWGFYGMDHVREEAKSTAEWFNKQEATA